MSIRRKLLLALPLATLLIVAGCKVNTINYFPPHPANVRVMNLMPGTPGIDVKVAGNPAFSGVQFETATGYQSFDNVTTTFTVSLTGSTTALSTFTYPLAGEQPYTLILYGSPSNASATLLAEVANPPTNGNIQVSVFNAAINNAGVDIYVTAPGADLSTLNPSYYSVGYNGASLNLAFAPGTYEIRITEQGTKTVIYDSGGSELTPNIALAMVAYSRGSGSLVNVAVLQSQGPAGLLNTIFASIKGLNNAPVVGPVNQLLNTDPANLNIPFAATSAYFIGPAGPVLVDYEASATPGAVLASVPVTLAPATDYSSFIAGLPGSQQAFVLVDDNSPPAATNTSLRFVNASWDANPVNVAVNGTPQATAVAYPTASPYVQFPTGTVAFTFTDAVTGAVLASLDNVVLIGGTATVYLVGPSGANAAVITQDN